MLRLKSTPSSFPSKVEAPGPHQLPEDQINATLNSLQNLNDNSAPSVDDLTALSGDNVSEPNLAEEAQSHVPTPHGNNCCCDLL